MPRKKAKEIAMALLKRVQIHDQAFKISNFKTGRNQNNKTTPDYV